MRNEQKPTKEPAEDWAESQPTISGQVRNTLATEIILRLHSVSDLEDALRCSDWDAVREMGQRFADDLTLMSEDLGWEAVDPDATITLTSPIPTLRRCLSRWNEVIRGRDEQDAVERRLLREREVESGLLIEGIEGVMRVLGRDQPPQPENR